MDVIGVRDIALVRHAGDDAKALLQALGKFVGRGFQRRAIEAEVDVRFRAPLGAGRVQIAHNIQRKRRRRGIGVGLARHILHALIQARIAERDGRIAVVEELVNGLALRQARQRAILPQDGGRVGQRALQALVTAHQCAVAQVQPLVENFPELVHFLAGGQRHIDKVQRHDALVEAAVILRLARLIVPGVGHIVPAVAGGIRRQKAAAAHAGVDIAVARRLALRELELPHFLFGDIVRHHAARRALRSQPRQVEILRILVDVVLLEHIDELREGRGDPHALFVLHALIALTERLLDDDGKIMLLLRITRLAEVHEHRDERRLAIRCHERDDLILDGLHAALDLLAQALLDDLGNTLLRGLGPELTDLAHHTLADLPAADIHERGQMRQRDGLAAILVRGDLRDDLRGDIAGRGEGMRLFDERAGDDRAVLQHVLEIDKVAVVHMLGIVIRIVEVDDTGLMRLDDVARQQDAARDVLRDLARHIVALHGVDGRVLVGVLLLDLLVVAFDEGQDAVVRRVGLADETAGIAIGDIALGDLEGPVRHDLVLDEVLNLLDGQAAVHFLAADRNGLRDAVDLQRRQALGVLGRIVGLCDGHDDFFDSERLFRSISLDDLHGILSLGFARFSVLLRIFDPFRTISAVSRCAFF